MIATPISSSAVRAVLLRYDILDTPPEPAFDDLAQRAAEVFGATMAGISFFDTGDVNAARSMSSSDGLGRGAWREWFKSRVNFPVDSMARELSFFLPSASATEHRLRILWCRMHSPINAFAIIRWFPVRHIFASTLVRRSFPKKAR